MVVVLEGSDKRMGMSACVRAQLVLGNQPPPAASWRGMASSVKGAGPHTTDITAPQHHHVAKTELCKGLHMYTHPLLVSSKQSKPASKKAEKRQAPCRPCRAHFRRGFYKYKPSGTSPFFL